MILAGTLIGCGGGGGSDSQPEPIDNSPNASISGRYFIDENNNNQFDVESGLALADVWLLNASDQVIQQTKTSSDGTFSFTRLEAASYKVRFSAPISDHAFVSANIGNDTIDSDVVTANNNNQGETDLIKLSKSEVVSSVFAGISGRYFNDNNKNNLDDQEPGVANANIWLLNANGQIEKQTQSNSQGEYQFEKIAAGSYQVQFAAPTATKEFVTANQGADDSIDSDVESKAASGAGLTAMIKLTDDKVLMDIDAGIREIEISGKATCIETYDWPTAPSEAFLSDRYSVSFSQNGKTIPAQVIKSISKDIEIADSWVSEFKAITPEEIRTFNRASFSSSFCDPIDVTVTKLWGTGTQDVEIVPSPYGITPNVSADGMSVTFTMDEQKYVAVNFKTDDNKQTSDGVVRHAFMLFADPEEKDIPDMNDAGVHVYSETSTKAEMTAADTIYFPPGYHDLGRLFKDTNPDLSDSNVWKTETVSNMGPVLSDGQQVYFAGGAYVHGRIYTSVNDVKIFGRGVLSGRDFKWAKKLDTNGGVLGVDSYKEGASLIGLSGDRNIIEGVAVCDSAGHGVNLGNESTYRHFKLWGWHANNDGARPWGNKPNIIDKSFFKAVDDVFYNKSLIVTDTVMWQGSNGSIVTLGWNGGYDTENSVFINNYIIYPEWRGLGNNNGIVMSQIDFDMSGTNVLIRNLHIDGNIPALVNLHNNSSQLNKAELKIDNQHANRTTVGKVQGVHFENITVTGKQVIFDGSGYQQTPKASKGLIEGTILDNGDMYKISDVSFNNVTIDGKCLDNSNQDSYNSVDSATTENIVYHGCSTQLHTISLTSSDNGSIKPLEGSMEILEGKSQTFTFKADTGYKLSDILVNGESKGALANYTVSNASADVSIEAVFTAN
ncbi:SdrD B-like domain-containing protein [Catenovulum maritimum]|uniref:SdrD B-like domain-containing protein n=1 Tax=Catenovulum maritimum TaxID=1513271 RepID=UPI00066167D7|nr:SdrD B-like domain-containing protein [Catenovulum maritimum]